MSAFQNDVLSALQRLEPGEVVTYGEIAAQAGHPGAARAIGNILRNSSGVPWWRVVSSQGRLVPGCEVEQARRLMAEGVTLRSGRVVRQEQG
jgi:methylated-DNA-protein-cysteine methyltransferase-like protein